MGGWVLSYPQMMAESIRNLEKFKEKRIDQNIPLLSYQEKSELLESYHPDFRAGSRRNIVVGANKGDQAPHEIVDLLEARSLVNPSKVNLDQVHETVDVLVIGGGGGGATAALFAQAAGANVAIATKLRFGDSNTIMAEGGINACTSKGDSPARYYVDTMGGGGFTNIPELVRVLVEDSPEIIQWLEELGVPFYREKDGNFIKRHIAGGHTRPRGHAVGDYTGMAIIQILCDEVFNRGIKVFEFSPAVEFILDEDGRCAGAIVMNLETNTLRVIKSKLTILATGGLGRLHIQNFPTTNHYGATADGIVMAYRAGVKLVYMDSIQFHPTGTCHPQQLIGLLVSEAVRARGAQLVNSKGERFINELETRNVVASAIIKESTDRKNGIKTPDGRYGIWLDTSVIDVRQGKGFCANYFQHLCHRFGKYGIDFTRGPILVYPSQHYQNGGILTDIHGQTDVPSLYAVGEVAGGVHGNNRLGGNSLTDIFVFGRRAGIHAGNFFKDVEVKRPTLSHIEAYQHKLVEAGVQSAKMAPMLLPDYSNEKAVNHYDQ